MATPEFVSTITEAPPLWLLKFTYRSWRLSVRLRGTVRMRLLRPFMWKDGELMVIDMLLINAKVSRNIISIFSFRFRVLSNICYNWFVIILPTWSECFWCSKNQPKITVRRRSCHDYLRVVPNTFSFLHFVAYYLSLTHSSVCSNQNVYHNHLPKAKTCQF